jgi:hypothetical protein
MGERHMAFFTYDPNTKTTHYFVQDKMMLSQNYNWNPNGGNGKGDSIGRSRNAYFVYGDPQFVEGTQECWVRIDCDQDHEDCSKWTYYYKPQRYPTPDYYHKDFSRDHTSNTFVLMKLAGEEEWAKEVASHVRWVITRKHRMQDNRLIRTHTYTPALWGFVKHFAGKWWGKPLFYAMNMLEVPWYNIQNGFCYLMGWFSRELHPEDYNSHRMTRQKQSKWRQFWASATYPIYALSLFGWQLYVMDDGFMKRLLQYMSYLLIPRHNHFLKLLFNVGKVTKKQVLEYRSMKGGRWGTPLNEINDRHVFIIEDEKNYDAETLLAANVLDVDILIKMWNIRHPEDQIT